MFRSLLRLWRRLSVAAKLAAVLAMTGIVGLASGWTALSLVISPSFASLENQAIEKQIGRANSMLESALSSLQNSASDYAVWDDSYIYTETADHAFEDETLTTLALVNLKVNGIAYVRFDGVVLSTRYVDLIDGVDSAVMNDAFRRYVSSAKVIEVGRNHPISSEFVSLANNRIVAMAVAQVVKSDGSGSPSGYLVMAKELADDVASAALQTDVHIAAGDSGKLLTRSPDFWKVAISIKDSDGTDIGTVGFHVPTDISSLGSSTMFAAAAAIVVVIALMMIGIFVAIRGVVVRRLRLLEAKMQDVSPTGELTELGSDPNSDELGSLVRSFNSMVEQLRELREQLRMNAFELGRSNSAAGALHNVRNTLSPVTVILSQVASETSGASSNDVKRALDELAKGDTAPDRRGRLATFVRAAFDDVEVKAHKRTEAVNSAKASLVEALGILTKQVDAAQTGADVERFDILEVIKRSATVARYAPWGEIPIALPAVGQEVCCNRTLLSQVITNLLTNAAESIAAADRHPGRIVVELTRITAHGKGGVEISIADDGKGFEPGTESRLFSRGYTTKLRSGGLGLHWCANEITRMNGTLTLVSTGLNQGALATIVLYGQQASVAADQGSTEQAA